MLCQSPRARTFLYITVLLMLLAGCAAPTAQVPEVSPTVAATPTPAEATKTPEPTTEVQPTAAMPATPPSDEAPTVAPPSPTILPDTQVEPPYEDREDPVRLLASYFNAVNRKEYARAYEYWENPPNPSYEEFVQGYADTASVLLAVRPPSWVEGAAGSQYASVPTLLMATHVDGSRHAFVGCYVTRRANPDIAGADGAGWSLYDATVSPTPGNATDGTLLAEACADLTPPQPEPPYDDRQDPVSVLASYYNAVNRKEYARAYDYWETPPNRSYEEFVQGYADTASVLLVVRPPTWVEGAAASQYASIATLLVATHTDGSQHSFVGCFVARRPNPEMGGKFAEASWSLYSATVAAAPGNVADAALLAEGCATG